MVSRKAFIDKANQEGFPFNIQTHGGGTITSSH